MRNAYALLGIGFIIIIASLFFLGGTLKPESQIPQTSSMLTLTSPAFSENEVIPAKYTCDGENVSPPLSIAGVPEGTKSLVLLMDDPDVPKALKPDGVFDHWVLYGIAPNTKEIPEGTVVGNQGLNGRGKDAYTGPCPPPQYQPREHRYFFKLYALDTTLTFIKVPTKADLEGALEGHTLESAELIGRYERTH